MPEAARIRLSNVAGRAHLELIAPGVRHLFRGGVVSSIETTGPAVRAAIEARHFGRRKLRHNLAETVVELNELREKGFAVLEALTGDALDRQRFMLALQTIVRRAPAGSVPEMVFESDVDAPLDLIPALEPPQGIRFRGPGSVLAADARRCFLGARFAVRKERPGGGPLSRNLTLNASAFADGPRVPLAVYWNRRLGRMDDELRLLQEFEVFEVSDPLPDDGLLRTRDEAGLAQRLVIGSELPRSIVHVTSHCDASKTTEPLNHALVLGGRVGLMHRLVELSVSVTRIQYEGRNVPPGQGPLAFVSACAATDLDLDSPTSIPQALLGAGFRAVVSPLVTVHVDPALAIAMYFYDALRHPGTTVGEALVRARLLLLERHLCPTGLLYTCYGETRLRLDEEAADIPLRRQPLSV